MNRLFGSSSKAPTATLDDSRRNAETAIARLDVQLREKETQLREHATKMKTLPPSRREAYKENYIVQIFRDKKKLEKDRRKYQEQVNTVQSVQMVQDTIKNSLEMTNSMKVASKQLEKQYAKVDLDEIERAQDKLADMLDLGNEIQETISRGFGNPEEIDESELDAELDALGEEVEYELEMQRNSAVPGFLEEEVPEFIDEPPEVDKAKVQEVAR